MEHRRYSLWGSTEIEQAKELAKDTQRDEQRSRPSRNNQYVDPFNAPFTMLAPAPTLPKSWPPRDAPPRRRRYLVVGLLLGIALCSAMPWVPHYISHWVWTLTRVVGF